MLNGIPVYTDDNLTETIIDRPNSRFIEYDEGDDWWLLKYGFANLKVVPSNKVYHIKSPIGVGQESFIMHSNLLNKIKSLSQEDIKTIL